MIKELVKWRTRDKNLQHRVHVAHVSSVDKTSRLQERNLITVLSYIITQCDQDICKQFALLRYSIRCDRGGGGGARWLCRWLGAYQIGPALVCGRNRRTRLGFSDRSRVSFRLYSSRCSRFGRSRCDAAAVFGMTTWGGWDIRHYWDNG